MQQQLSIIIPTFNEAAHIGQLIAFIHTQQHPAIVDIIVSDGGSTDATVAIAKTAGAFVVHSPKKGRAAQMNFGAAHATGSILYFVHADTQPPAGFATDILQAIANGFNCGRYQTRFTSKQWYFKMTAFFTRFNWFICYGGDQTFFIESALFNRLGGYKDELKIMEEYELTERVQQVGRYIILPGKTLISTRKYEGRGWLKVQLANRKAIALYRSGASQDTIANTYRKMLG